MLWAVRCEHRTCTALGSPPSSAAFSAQAQWRMQTWGRHDDGVTAYHVYLGQTSRHWGVVAVVRWDLDRPWHGWPEAPTALGMR